VFFVGSYTSFWCVCAVCMCKTRYNAVMKSLHGPVLEFDIPFGKIVHKEALPCHQEMESRTHCD